MMTLQEFLEKQFDEDLMLAVLSGQRSKEKDVPSRVRIRPIELKGSVCYQASSTVGTKVLHSNYTREEIISYVEANLGEGCFSQFQIQGRCVDGTVLVSKKGRQTIKVKKHPARETVRIQAHNRVKQYILKEGTAVPFLVDLGVMNREGKIHNTSYDKFKQINRFLEFIEDILPALSREREITILDFGCGKSYLTFAMYYYLKELKGYDVNIIGLDLKEDVIKKCNGLAGKYGYDKLHFLHGDIADYEGVQKVDMVVTLHACDTATDFALYNAITWNAKMIFSVPCCQHEVNKQIQSEDYSLLTRYGIIKERFSALTTDAIRANLLECCGYKTQLLEFIDFEHTPKNILTRAVRRPVLPSSAKKKYLAEVENMCREFHLEPTLYTLLRNDCKV